MANNNWESLQRRAKYLEARLESKINEYSQLTQNYSSNLHDEENPLVESKEERDFASDIEKDLNELSDCVANMRKTSPSIPQHQYESIIKRYHEIHFDHTTEFNNASTNIQRKRNTFELFKSSRSINSKNDQDPAMAHLLSEGNSIKSSLKGVNDLIGQAFETKNALLGQKATLNNSSSGLLGIASSLPTLQKLIEGIQKKRAREAAVIATVIGSLLSITVWWIFLR